MRQQTLRKVLWADAIVSAASGVLTAGGALVIGRWLDVSAWVPLLLALAMLPWVLLLARTARQLRPKDLRAAIAINVGYAIATAAIVVILGFPDTVATPGWVIIGYYAIGALCFGIGEWIGLRSNETAQEFCLCAVHASDRLSDAGPRR